MYLYMYVQKKGLYFYIKEKIHKIEHEKYALCVNEDA